MGDLFAYSFSVPASPPSGCASPTARATPTAPACQARVEGTALDGLIGEWRDNGERKYYLSNLPPRTSLRRLAAAVKARWSCEQAHQQLKQELGLGDFEARSWTGLHRHALMTCSAFAYLQHRRLKPAGRGKKVDGNGPPPQPSLPEIRRAIIAKLFAPPPVPYRCPHCHRRLPQHASNVPR